MVTTNYTDVFSGNLVGPAFPQYSAITLSSNIDLAWPTDFQNLNMVVSLIMDISPTVDDEYQITLPDATKAGTGFVFKINNPSGHDFDLLDNTGEHLTTINGGEAQEIWLVGNTTSAGSWRFLPMSGGSAVTYVDATSSTDNLTIAGVPIIGAGTIAFTLAKDLLALSTFESATGFSARTAVNTWALRTITGTSGSINVTAGDGVSGNPTIALNPNISITSLVALTSVQGGNIELVGNSITSVNTNGPIDLEPNGNGPVTLPATNPLLFYATNGTNYISFQGGGSVVNQTYIWPTTTPTAGQSLGFSGGSTLAWLATPSVPGATTINAIARFSNISGGLKDSPGITLDDAGNLVSLASCVISDIVIGGTGSGQQTITTTTADESLILAPNGLGAVECQGDIWVYPSSGVQRKVRFYTSAGSSGHYAGLIANNSMTTSPIWSLPIAGSLAGVFYTDTSNVMSIKPFFIGPSVIGNVPSFVDTVGTLQDSGTSLFTGPSTVNAIATFSNITGSLQNSNLTYSSGVIASSVSEFTLQALVGDLNLEANGGIVITTAIDDIEILSSHNVQITADGNIGLTAVVGTGLINSSSDICLLHASNQLKLRLYNTAATHYAGLGANATMAVDKTWLLPGTDAPGYMLSDGSGNLSFLALTTTANTIATFSNTTGSIQNSAFTLPASAPAATGLIKSNSSGVISIDTLGATAGVLTTNGSAGVTIATATTVANQLAKYSSTTMSSLTAANSNTGTFLDSNNNLSIGTTSIGTGATTTITLKDNGGYATAMSGGNLSIGNKTTGSGNVIALFGGGDGGISASVSAVVTNKISVYVNGTRYYLLASTSAT